MSVDTQALTINQSQINSIFLHCDSLMINSMYDTEPADQLFIDNISTLKD